MPAASGVRGVALMILVAMALSTGAGAESLAALAPSHGADAVSLAQRLAEPARRPERAAAVRRQQDRPDAQTQNTSTGRSGGEAEPGRDGGLVSISPLHLASAWLLSLPPPARARAA